MTGKYNIKVFSLQMNYSLTIKRKFTIIKGNSATGKSYLFTLLSSDDRDAVKIECKVEVITAPTKSSLVSYLKGSGRIIFVDEGSSIFKDLNKDEMKLLLKSDNYFVFITRTYLKGLPYSIKEIYSLETRGKNTVLKPCYDCNSVKFNGFKDGSVIITEDSKSGNYIYRKELSTCTVYPEYGSNGGKSYIKNLYKLLANKGILDNKIVYIIIDSAAFGDDIDELFGVISMVSCTVQDTILLTPESFEFLICSVKLGKNAKEIVKTYDLCDVKEYPSWENYFAALVKRLIPYYRKNKLCLEVKEMSKDIINSLEEFG